MDIVVIAILVIEILGFGLGGVVVYRMKQQIGALKGMVEAQAETLRTFSELNKIAVEMARASDPKRYLENGRDPREAGPEERNCRHRGRARELERDRQHAQEGTREGFDRAMREYESALHAGLQLVAYVPPDRRGEAIAATPKSLQPAFSKVAAHAPDMSRGPAKLMSLSEIFAAAEAAETPLSKILGPQVAEAPPRRPEPS